MRDVVNISLPSDMVRMVKDEVKFGQYVSVSEFFRHLLRSWNTNKLAQELKNDRLAFAAGKGKVLKSLKDLR